MEPKHQKIVITCCVLLSIPLNTSPNEPFPIRSCFVKMSSGSTFCNVRKLKFILINGSKIICQILSLAKQNILSASHRRNRFIKLAKEIRIEEKNIKTSIKVNIWDRKIALHMIRRWLMLMGHGDGNAIPFLHMYLVQLAILFHMSPSSQLMIYRRCLCCFKHQHK